MTASHDIPHSADLVAGPEPVESTVSDSQPGIFDRLSTPLWIAIGISVIALAILAALG